METKEKTVIERCSCNHIGQVKKEEAQKEVDRMNKLQKGNNWRIDTSDILFEIDDFDYPEKELEEGYVWVVKY